MDNLLFYLKGKGHNLLDETILDEFTRQNPELLPFVFDRKLHLKILDIGYFEAFCYWIISQQISGSVAEILITRFNQLLQENISPEHLANYDGQNLRDIGLSSSKIQYIRNTARYFKTHMNKIGMIKEKTKEEIMEFFGQIKGVGPWTINLFLIFNLGRLDIAAPKDLVVRKGLQQIYALDKIPTIIEAANIMEKYGGYATVGTILAWSVMGE